MRSFVRPSLGLFGRVLVILLVTVLLEFVLSTLLYERASRFSVRADEARRLAEHLVVSRKLVMERPIAERAGMADELTTNRYSVRWEPSMIAPSLLAPEPLEIQRQVVSWEPSLGDSSLRMRLVQLGRRSFVTGAMRLPDDTWLYFSTREVPQALERPLGRMILAFIPAVALLMMSAFLIRRSFRPLRALIAAAGQIGIGEGTQVEERGTGEVRRLVRAFNAMQNRIHRLIVDRTQALAAVGHDLRTPLARLQLRLDQVGDGKVRHAIASDVEEMEAMVSSLLAFLGGEDDPERPQRVDLAVLAATAADTATDLGHQASYAGPRHLDIVVRPTAIKRALGNLVDNAVSYGSCANVILDARPGEVLLTVEDEGPGIPDDRLAEVTAPFVRLDAARLRDTKGLGLGLAIVTRAVEREGGRLTLCNRPNGGLRATIHLPL